MEDMKQQTASSFYKEKSKAKEELKKLFFEVINDKKARKKPEMIKTILELAKLLWF